MFDDLVDDRQQQIIFVCPGNDPNVICSWGHNFLDFTQLLTVFCHNVQADDLMIVVLAIIQVAVRQLFV